LDRSLSRFSTGHIDERSM